MLTIKKSEVSFIDSTLLATEASGIGLAPGEWPDFISVLDNNNEGFLFMKSEILELVGMYQTKDGHYRLHVWND